MNYLLYDAIWNLLRDEGLSQSKCDEIADKLYKLLCDEKYIVDEDEEWILWK